jgi:cysteine desulfurase
MDKNWISFLYGELDSVYCSTGVGALYVRKRPRVRLEPIINGGGQERGLRSGTVPSPLAVGLGAACSICKQEMDVRIFAWNNLKIFGN